MIKKDYTIIKDVISKQKMLDHIKEKSYFAFDVETTGLNVRKKKVIGFSISGEEGKAFYYPILYWKDNNLVNYPGNSFHEAREILESLKEKELLMWNGSFDIRITKNDLGIDLLDALMSDGMLMAHTLMEEGPFGLKKVGVLKQDIIGYDVEETADKEAQELKANVEKNGGSTTRANYEMYKADLDVLGKYACFAKKSSIVTLKDGSAKYIEDVEKGDYVLDHGGDFRKVYDTLKQRYSGEVFDIETEVGRMQKNVTPDHRFLILNQETLKEEWKSVKDIKEHDLLVRPTINKYTKPQRSHKRYKNKGENFWWLFGLHQAEGHVSNRNGLMYPVLSIHQDESKIVSKALKKEGHKPSVHFKKGSKGCDITVCDSSVGKEILELCGGSFKCHEKKVNSEVLDFLLNNKKEALSFLAGVFDGDGHYRSSKKVHQLTLEVTSASLVNTIDLLLTSLGVNSTRGTQIPQEGRRLRHYIKVFGKDISIFKGYCRIKDLSDIKTKEKDITTFKKYARIKRITKKRYKGYVYNIEVSKTHSYISNGIVSHNCADADITLRLCEHFYSELEKENLLEFFFDEEVMPLYKEVTIPMEDRGVKLDVDLINKTKQAVEDDLLKLEESIVTSLFKLEEAQKWYLDCIDKYTEISPRGNFAQGLIEYYKIDLPKTAKGKYSTTKKKVEALKDSEAKDFLMGLPVVLPESDVKAIKKNLYEKANDKKINISSKPQLSEIVFEYMGIKELAKTPKGKKKFDDDMISKIADQGHEWAKLLGDYNKLIKIKGTYLDRFLNSEEDGTYYFSYKQHGTISGRYGSDAQQLPRPKEEGELSPLVLQYSNEIRKFFIAGEGRKFVDCDYESLEPHVFAHVSGEEGIKDIFRKGHDFYSTIAIATEGIDGVSADKKAENYLGKVDPKRRQDAKAYSLGVPYGMRGYALGKTLDIPTEDAEKLVENYLGAYPELSGWIATTKDKVRKDGYIATQVGRVRHLPKVKALYKKHKDKLLDYKYRNKIGAKIGHDLVKEMYRDYKNGENNSINFQIQSLSASIVNRAAIAINRYFKANNIDGWCCAQIHDQLIINIPDNNAENHAKEIQNLMENTTKLSLDLKSPPCLADNWYDGH